MLRQVLVLTSSRRVMGAAFVNSRLRKVTGWMGASIVLAVNCVLVWEATNGAAWSLWTALPAVAGMGAYVSFVAYLIIGPERCASPQLRMPALHAYDTHPPPRTHARMCTWVRA